MNFDPPLEHLTCTRDEAGVATLRLDNPSRRNAMSAPMTDSWVRAIAALRNDPQVRVVVVTGAGDAFCSGGDTGWIAEAKGACVNDLRAKMLPFYRAWLTIRDLEVPTIAAINGPAVGAGMCLALATDLRYAASGATLSVPFTRLGMHAGMAATWLLPQVAGLPVAREMLLTGRVLSGEEAAAAGVVNRAYPAEDLAAEVAAIASAVAGCAPIPTRLTKVALARGGHADLEAAIQWEGLAQPVTMAGEDLYEGLAAAKERRPPRFTGR